MLSGTASFDTGTLTVSLQMQNQAGRIIFNPKVVITAVTGTAGSFNNADGTLDTDSFRHCGAAGLAIGATRSCDLEFTTVGASDVLQINVEIVGSPMLVGFPLSDGVDQFRLIDTGAFLLGGEERSPIATHGSDGDYSRFSGDYIPADGSKVYLGSRHQPVVTNIDLTDFGTSYSVRLSDEAGHVFGLIPSADEQSLYAGVGFGHHNRGSNADADAFGASVVRLDTATLAEVERVDIYPPMPVNDPIVRAFALSPDETMAALTVRSKTTDNVDNPAFLYLVDLTTMTVIDTDSETEGTQPIDMGGTMHVSVATFSADGGTLYLGGNDTVATRLAKLDLTSYQLTPIAIGGAETEVKALEWNAAGDLVVAVKANDPSIFILSGDVLTPQTGYLVDVHGLEIMADGNYMIVNTVGVDWVDSSNRSVLNTVASFSLKNHHFPITPF
jgi:hypothetical protein